MLLATRYGRLYPMLGATKAGLTVPRSWLGRLPGEPRSADWSEEGDRSRPLALPRLSPVLGPQGEVSSQRIEQQC